MDEKEDDIDKMGFPEGYEYLEGLTRDAVKRARELDQRIKNIPVEEPKQFHQRLQYNALALDSARRAWPKRENRDILEEQKAANEKELRRQLDIYLKDADPKDATVIRTIADEKLHPNPFEGMTREQLDKVRGMEKDLEHSQDFMRAELALERSAKNERLKAAQNKLEKLPEKEEKQQPVSLSSRYAQSLTSRYLDNSKEMATAKTAPAPKKGKEEKDRD